MVTDHSAAERAAWRTVFPSTKRWLCHYHLGKTFTSLKRELSSVSGESTTDRFLDDMRGLKDTMTTEAQALQKMNDMEHDPSYLSFASRIMKKYFKIGQDWIMAYRSGHRVGMQHTTNVSESQHNYIKTTFLMGESLPSLPTLLAFFIQKFDIALAVRLANKWRTFRPSTDKYAFDSHLRSYNNTITASSGAVTFVEGDISVTATCRPLTCTCIHCLPK